MAVDRVGLKGIYARLKGIERAIPINATVVALSIGDDFNEQVEALATTIEEDTDSFRLPPSASDKYGDRRLCETEVLRSKLLQLISYLEYMFHVSTEIIEIGSLFNSIRDEELKNRCADLLSAPGAFDRVINQATQVLEDRIRTKSQHQGNATGVQLVNEVLKNDLNNPVLRVSDDKGEQRGICDVCRGMMAAFRNPTHHRITDRFTREDALKLCAFVDNLLQIIDNATVERR